MSDQDHNTPNERDEPEAERQKTTYVPIINTAGDSYRFLMGDFARFLRFMWIPMLVSIAYSYYNHLQLLGFIDEVQRAQSQDITLSLLPSFGAANSPASIAFSILMWAIMLFSLRSVIRFVLLREDVPNALGFRVDRASLRFVGYAIVVFALGYAVQALGGLLMFGVMALLQGPGSFVVGVGGVMAGVLMLVVTVISIVIHLRLSFVPITAAVDGSGRLGGLIKWAWSTVRGNTIHLFAIVVLIAIPIAATFWIAGGLFLHKIMFNTDQLGALAGVAIMTVLSFAWMYMMTYAFCEAYRFIVWGGLDDESLATETPSV